MRILLNPLSVLISGETKPVLINATAIVKPNDDFFLPPSPVMQAALANINLNAFKELSAKTELNANRAKELLLHNIAPFDGDPGAVIASPSRQDPDYYYHWIRDAALVMEVLRNFSANAQMQEEKNAHEQRLKNYINFSRINQTTPNRSGQIRHQRTMRREANLNDLGEPKFHVDGSAFNGDWGRPQDDGPALRALTLTRFAHSLLDRGDAAYVRELLYDGGLPSDTVIKNDLEFVAHRWRRTSFELWEEVRGHHFYTRLTQRRALLEGAKLADRLNDPKAASYYREQAKHIEDTLQAHWDEKSAHLKASIHVDGGLGSKNSQLDVSVILAALHAEGDDGLFDVTDDRVLATTQKLIDVFRAIYPINRDDLPGTVLGRYPEDTFFDGNPWVLATAALGELYFKSAKKFSEHGEITVTALNEKFFNHALEKDGAVLRVAPGMVLKSGETRFIRLISVLIAAGKRQIERVHYHANADGSLSEQIDKTSGHMKAAPHLTWSYAAYLTLLEGRKAAGA